MKDKGRNYNIYITHIVRTYFTVITKQQDWTQHVIHPLHIYIHIIHGGLWYLYDSDREEKKTPIHSQTTFLRS